MANAAQRRKSIRQENVSMRKALEKLHRKVDAKSVLETASASAEVPPVAAAAAGSKASGDWLTGVFGKGKAALKTTGGKTAAGIGIAMLIEALVSGALNIAGKVGESNLQGQAMNAQAEALRGPAGKEKAMQPITKAQRDQAMMLLMRQLGVQQSNLADGEALT